MTETTTIIREPQPDDLLTEREAASMLRVSPGTLSVWRCARRYKLPYVKVGRCVRYVRRHVDEFLAANTRDMDGAS